MILFYERTKRIRYETRYYYDERERGKVDALELDFHHM